eukprot:CAMPEP_0171735520 /NCGR_PEP_ID=MMETSP0991-20121206/31639_1 /TAXON_ID=483369 /ORGANISM="non described non described, Strain CCMP2098" /LENGTH=93 /DNA_ID=CAMNT_0012331867 /DNA_START=23 /DNA_END=304 /DNA_ORIENTATION=+
MTLFTPLSLREGGALTDVAAVVVDDDADVAGGDRVVVPLVDELSNMEWQCVLVLGRGTRTEARSSQAVAMHFLSVCGKLQLDQRSENASARDN